jgi:colanic acid/amylovoran biosynthesis glycosyltransferase
MRMAYLTSEYPAISHTFILREIDALRRADVDIQTISIRKPSDATDFPDAERQEISSTHYVQSGSHVAATFRSLVPLLRHPWATLKMLRAAFGLYRSHSGVGAAKFASYIAEAALLTERLERAGIKHVHVHFANPAATVAYLAACSGRIEFSLSVHGSDIFYDVSANFLREKFSKAVFVRCISDFCRSQVLRLMDPRDWPKAFVVRLGIDFDEYAPRPHPNNEVPQLLCVGRLVAAKGHHVLLLACAELAKQGLAAEVTFVGDGPDRKSLESLAQSLGLGSRATFAGSVNRDRVHAYYDQTDLFVLPSFAEGLPVVLMEAMAKKIPVVSTRITGIPELIDSGSNGLLVSASSVGELAGAISLMLSEPEKAAAFADRGLDTVRGVYNLAATCDKLVAEFRSRLIPEER